MRRESANLKKVFVLLLLSLAQGALANDISNVKKEDSLNQIYKTYNAQPTDQTIWSLVAGQSGMRSYKTQKGDTLWEISEMLFGDGFFWPKVWSLNPEITNPHDVPPGTILSFFPGNMNDAPSISLDRKQPEALPEVLALTLNVELPPPQKESSPPLTVLPDSIPLWKFKKDPNTIESIELKRPPRNFPVPLQHLSYFASEGPTQGEGEVLGAELGMDSAGEFQYLFVRGNGLAVGQTVLAVKDIGDVEDSFAPEKQKKKATLVQIQGLMEIVEPVDSAKGTFRAIVKKTIAPIEKGAKVLTSDFPYMNVEENGDATQIPARIFGGQFGLSRRIFGPDGIVFLNQGSRAGISEGQILNVYKNQYARTDASPVVENPRVIGRVKIVKTTEEFATAVVTSATEEIRVGDGTSPDSISK